MNVTIIASPDKLSLAMSMSFMRHKLGTDFLLGVTHSLMSEEALNLYTQDLMKKSDKLLISYYARKKINKDPLKVIPAKLMEIGTLVIWMKLFSTELIKIKDTSNVFDFYKSQWDKNIKILNNR